MRSMERGVAQVVGEEAGILAAFAADLGLSADGLVRLLSRQVVDQPGGLPWRLHLLEGAARLRPEVFLPLRLQDLDGQGLAELLVIQAALVQTSGWYLGPSGAGGLSLLSGHWIEGAGHAAAALREAQIDALAVMLRLVSPGQRQWA